MEVNTNGYHGIILDQLFTDVHTVSIEKERECEYYIDTTGECNVQHDSNRAKNSPCVSHIFNKEKNTKAGNTFVYCLAPNTTHEISFSPTTNQVSKKF